MKASPGLGLDAAKNEYVYGDEGKPDKVLNSFFNIIFIIPILKRNPKLIIVLFQIKLYANVIYIIKRLRIFVIKK